MIKPFMPVYVRPPCHDYAHDCDCQDHSEGCHGKCEKWNAYLAKRNERYDQRKEQVRLNNALSEMHDIRRARHSNVVDAFRNNRGIVTVKECKE